MFGRVHDIHCIFLGCSGSGCIVICECFPYGIKSKLPISHLSCCSNKSMTISMTISITSAALCVYQIINKSNPSEINSSFSIVCVLHGSISDRIQWRRESLLHHHNIIINTSNEKAPIRT
eukprot:471810_1